MLSVAGVANCREAQLYCYSIPFAEARGLKPPNLFNDIDRAHVASIAGPEVIDPGLDTVRDGGVAWLVANNLIGGNP